jgi:3-deoxy-D-manno-octulosonic-acid transferase
MLEMGLYNLSLGAYRLGVVAAAAFGNSKAHQRLEAVRHTRLQLQQKSAFPKSSRKRIWIHAASWGEYEMARPIMQAWRTQQADVEFVVSLFSPSGLKHAHKLQAQDELLAVLALDWDTKKAARRWVQSLQPDLAVFIRYDHWLHHLAACQTADTPTILAAQQHLQA